MMEDPARHVASQSNCYSCALCLTFRFLPSPDRAQWRPSERMSTAKLYTYDAARIGAIVVDGQFDGPLLILHQEIVKVVL